MLTAVKIFLSDGGDLLGHEGSLSILTKAQVELDEEGTA